MKQLVKSWLEAEQESGNSISEAIDMMNECLEMYVTHSRVSEWRRGIYVPSQKVLSYMLHRTLRWALKEVGVTEVGPYNALVRLLWEINVTDGEPYVELL